VIWLEPQLHLLRVIDGDPSDRPDYRAVGSVFAHGDVAVLAGFHGDLTRNDMRQIMTSLSCNGARYLLMERVGKHRIPLAKKISRPGEPFDGWWFIRLEDPCS
jgi:hypothetical protein